MNRYFRASGERHVEQMSGKDKAIVLNRPLPVDRGKRGRRMGERLEARNKIKGIKGPEWASLVKNTINGTRRVFGFSRTGHRINTGKKKATSNGKKSN